ncbi:RNA polymerase subunit sigma-70, partial [Bacillus thuringiensis]
MSNNSLAIFHSKYQNKLKEPILQRFLENSENYSLFLKAVEHPTTENKQLVDNAFKIHFKKIKIISYISNLIYFYSI